MSYERLSPEYLAESKRRRTFAIISHPDAGKTTLTGKFLLYCGAIREAGEVKAKAQRRKTVSDWMELEKQRGISVSSSVLQFEYHALKINLLDTPGHQDFSEDTYRTLMAADSAVMVIDAAKGVETQTKKLFEVCRMRKIPIFTFINKMDREGRDPFELMQEIEDLLKIRCNPLMWPLGMGPSFKGVYMRGEGLFRIYETAEKAGQRASEETIKMDPRGSDIEKMASIESVQKLRDDLDLVEGALGPFDHEAFLAGEETPVVFGSARNNFGISAFLEAFAKYAPGPQDKPADPEPVHPDEARFSAFVFKIQANMDKSHRDRMAFLRICSGRFERDMDVKHARLEKMVRLTHSKQFVARDRSTIDEAYSGDIIGIHDPGHFQIGDTVFTGSSKIQFSGIPSFSPECFGKLRLKDPIKRKQLQKGIEQLCEEGLVQLFVNPLVGMQDPVLGVVGQLQFDVMMFRLKDEYGVDVALDRMPYSVARWVRSTDSTVIIKELDLRVPKLQDNKGQWVLMFNSEWEIDYTKRNAPAALEWSANSF